MSDDPGVPVAKVGTVVKKGVELRFSAAGKPFAKFSLAVKPYVPKDQPQPETLYYDVTAFGTLAEHVAACINGSDRVVVLGLGKVESWTAKDGTERESKVIIADAIGPDLRFCGADIHRERRGPMTVPSYAENEEPF